MSLNMMLDTGNEKVGPEVRSVADIVMELAKDVSIWSDCLIFLSVCDE